MRTQGDPAQSISNDSSQRPTGMTIVSIIDFIGGALGVVLAVLLFAQALRGPASPRDSSGFFVLIAGVVVLVLAVAAMIVAVGLFRMKGWARVITIVVSSITFVITIVIGFFLIRNGLNARVLGLPYDIGALVIAVINAIIVYVVVTRK
jgi:hypothetical protein